MGVLLIFLSVGSFLLYQGTSGVDTEEVSVMEGDSVTLNTGVVKTQQDRIRWYFNDIRIAQINGDQSKICTDVQCNEGTERFRDRLKLDHQTGSLTITDIRNTDSGEYKLKITSGSSDSEKIFSVSVHERVSVSVSVKEGDSFTLNTGVEKKQQDRMKWYFNDIRIAQINGDPSKTCTDVQCNEGTERFRDRLKLDHQTGSLTITNIRNTDSGEYELQIFSSSTDSLKIFNVTVSGAVVSVFVMEGDSVTLHTDITTNQQDRIRWHFNHTRVAQINGDLSKICTDVQCHEVNERFRDRLELDHQTGSLTIMNTTNTDSGVYHLDITSRNSEKTFNVAVHGVSAAERDEVKKLSVKEGESVALDPGVRKTTNEEIRWYFNEILITEITGDQSKVCTDVQCNERFSGRLEVNQTGSLTITNTRNTDDGVYKLEITSSSSSFSIRRFKSFSVYVTGDSGLSSRARTGICAVAVVLLVVAAAVTAAVIYYRKYPSRRSGETEKDIQENGEYLFVRQNEDPPNVTSHNLTETASEISV